MKSKALMRVASIFRRGGIRLRKAAPTIAVAAGTASVVAGTVLACVASTKVPAIMEDHNNELEEIARSENSEKLVKKVYFDTIIMLVKKYAPGVCAVLVGLALILCSHAHLRKENALIGAQLFAVTQAFNSYREKVKAEIGDREAMFAADYHEIENEDGSKSVYISADENPNDYVATMNIDTSTIWIRNELDFNISNVEAIRRTLQNTLEAHGYLFLNDALDALGLKKTRRGYKDGWIFDKPTKVLDFRPVVVNGTYDASGICDYPDSSSIRLDFNCDGPILDRLPLEEV